MHYLLTDIQADFEINRSVRYRNTAKRNYFHRRQTSRTIIGSFFDKKEQDAREAMRVVFSVLTKRICMHKTNFLRTYSNIVLKVILNCMNMQIATQLIMMYNL